MKRDMDLQRKILLKIEEAKPFETLWDLSIDGYDMQAVAYHCKMLYDAGMIKEYHGITVDNFDDVLRFCVRDLTASGQDFIETIRDDSIWGKTKKTIKNKGLPMLAETAKAVAMGFVTAMAEGVANSILKNGGN